MFININSYDLYSVYPKCLNTILYLNLYVNLVYENILSFIRNKSNKHTSKEYDPKFNANSSANLINETRIYKVSNLESRYIETINEGKTKMNNNEDYILDILIGFGKEFTVYIDKESYPEVYDNIEYVIDNKYNQLVSSLPDSIGINFVSLNTPRKSKMCRDFTSDFKYDHDFKFYTLFDLNFTGSMSSNMKCNLNLLADILKENTGINKNAVEKIHIYDLSSEKTTICYTIDESIAIKNRGIIDDVYKGDYQKFIPIENLNDDKIDELIKNIDKHISDIINNPKYDKLYLDDIILNNKKSTEDITLKIKNICF